MPVRLRRTLLLTPGDDRHLLEKQAASRADVALLDLEDSIHSVARPAARKEVARSLRELTWHGKERLVRTSSMISPDGPIDIEEVGPAGPDGFLLSKVESAEEVMDAATILDRLDPGRQISIWCMVETARGLLEVDRLAACSPRLAGLMMGAGDLTLSLGIHRLGFAASRVFPGHAELGPELLYARSRVVAAARAAGIAAIDVGIQDVSDLEMAYRKALFSFQLGFDGKMVITPALIEPVHRAWAPSSDEVAWARKVVAAFAEIAVQGRGSAVVDGEPMDGPYLPYAERLLERAALASEADRAH
jgi:citrate lyase subunit beta / citryl-CoA lyase